VIRFAKWLFNSEAPVRPGCFSQVTLLISAAFALPGVATMLTGRLFPGFWMLFASCIPIVLFALPAWNAYRRSEAVEKAALRDAELNQRLQPESITPEPEDADEYTPLRKELEASEQSVALHQLTLLLDKKADFESVLSHKFKDTEVTYHRYLDSGQKVFDGAIRNLESVAAFGRSVRSVNQNSLLEQLDVMIENGEGNSRSAVALRERLEMMTEGRKHITALLESNEEALTALTRVSTKLAGISTITESTPDMERMIDDLREMAERSDRYNTSIAADKPTITLKD